MSHSKCKSKATKIPANFLSFAAAPNQPQQHQRLRETKTEIKPALVLSRKLLRAPYLLVTTESYWFLLRQCTSQHLLPYGQAGAKY